MREDDRVARIHELPSSARNFQMDKQPKPSAAYLDKIHHSHTTTMRAYSPFLLATLLLLFSRAAIAQPGCALQDLRSASVVVKPPSPSLVQNNMTLKFSSELFPIVLHQMPKPESANVLCAPRITAFYVYVSSTSAALDALVRTAPLQPDVQVAGVLRQTATKSRSGNTFGCAVVFPMTDLAVPGTIMHCRVAKRITNSPSRDVLVFSSNSTFVVPGAPANAGQDQTVTTGTNATLKGTLPTGNAPYSCYWTLIQGNGTIASPASLSTQVLDPALGVNTFQFNVTSASGVTTFDQVKVTVVPLR